MGPPFHVADSFTAAEDGGKPPDALHDYVLGTRFFIDVRAERWFMDLDAIEVVSKDPDVLFIEGQVRVDDHLRVTCLARGVGTAALALLDEQQRPLEERVVEVKRPDRLGLAILVDDERGFTIPAIDDDSLLIAQGGQVTFSVRYEHSGAELKGTGVLRGVSDVVDVVNPTRTGPDRELVTLQAPAEPTASVAVVLEVAGEAVRTLEVRTVDPAEIAAIELDTGEPGFQTNGSRYPVWAKAFDDDAEPIFGAPFRWNFDGTSVEGAGDVLFYEFAGGERRRVQVKAGGEVEDITVEAKAGSAELTASSSTSCAAGAPGALPLLLLALLSRRGRIDRGARARA